MAKETYNKSYQEIVELICQYLDYKKGKKFNTYLVKKLQPLREEYPDEVISETIREECWGITSKEFKNENQKINYLFAIINNNIFRHSIKYMQKKNMNEKMKLQNENNFVEEEIANIADSKKTAENDRDISLILEDF